MIDLHAHILPALDDGPQSDAAAVALARAAVAHGTRAIATTSHVNRSFGLQPDDLAGARAALAEVLRAAGVELELLAGGEIAHKRLPELTDDDLRALALGGGPFVLLECPLGGLDDLAPLVDDLHARGFRVLLGHPERSPAFQRDPERLERLVAGGALAQVTTGAFTGDFGPIAQRTALDMVDRGARARARERHPRPRPPAARPDGRRRAPRPRAARVDGGRRTGGDRGRRPAARPPAAAYASRTTAMTIPASTNTTISTCIQTQNGDIDGQG